MRTYIEDYKQMTSWRD